MTEIPPSPSVVGWGEGSNTPESREMSGVVGERRPNGLGGDSWGRAMERGVTRWVRFHHVVKSSHDGTQTRRSRLRRGFEKIFGAFSEVTPHPPALRSPLSPRESL
jgi:hypothetical protein